MVDIHAHPGGSLPIGRRGENLARRVMFDLAPWRKCYGDGTVQLLHQRAGDADPYPCALTVEGDVAYWLIRAADVDKPGWGDAQLHYYVGETLAKSSAWRTLTADALGAPGETPPEPQQDWVEKVLAAGTAAEDAAGRAEEAAVHPPYPSEETGTWWTWNAETGKYEDTGLSYGGSGEGGTTDHTKLTNRDAENQHPMSAITGLVGALDGKVSVADIINNLTTNAANKPLSAAQGVALKALIDAIRIPEKLPNPNALTFTGAATGNYDGSEAVTVNIPTGGGGGSVTVFSKDVVVAETVAQYRITGIDPTEYSFFSVQVDRSSGYTANLLLCFTRADGAATSWFTIADHAQDSAFIVVRPIDRIPWSIRMRYSNIQALIASSPVCSWYDGSEAPGFSFKNQDDSGIAAGTKISIRGYKFEDF